MNTAEYARILSEVIDTDRYMRLVTSLGNQLNERKDRFDKADIIEQAIEIYSNGRLQWVDEIGRDHRDLELGIDLEFKYSNNVLITKTGKYKKNIIVKLKNSIGTNKGVTIENPADYYVIGQRNAIAIIKGDDIKPFLCSVSDGIEARIPQEHMTYVFVSEIDDKSKLVEISYKEQKRKMQELLIESI